mgnify:CR=1 FL=1
MALGDLLQHQRQPRPQRVKGFDVEVGLGGVVEEKLQVRCEPVLGLPVADQQGQLGQGVEDDGDIGDGCLELGQRLGRLLLVKILRGGGLPIQGEHGGIQLEMTSSPPGAPYYCSVRLNSIWIRNPWPCAAHTSPSGLKWPCPVDPRPRPVGKKGACDHICHTAGVDAWVTICPGTVGLPLGADPHP